MLYMLILATLLLTVDAQAQWADHHGSSFGPRRSDATPKTGYGYRNRDGTTNYAPIVPRHGEIVATPPPRASPLRSPPPRASDPPDQMLQERSPEHDYHSNSISSDRIR
jgi:hypothetical protein